MSVIANPSANPQVRKFVIRREVQPKTEDKKPYTKAPRIQRLVTPQRLQHKRHRRALKRRKAEASKDAAVRVQLLLSWHSSTLPLSPFTHFRFLRRRIIQIKSWKDSLLMKDGSN